VFIDTECSGVPQHQVIDGSQEKLAVVVLTVYPSVYKVPLSLMANSFFGFLPVIFSQQLFG